MASVLPNPVLKHAAGLVPGAHAMWPANALGLDFVAAAAVLPKAALPTGATGIIDVHSHIQGAEAAVIYARVRELFGITLTYSMTQISHAAAVRTVLGDSIRFMAIPSFSDDDKRHAHTTGYLSTIERFHTEFGSRMMKVWASPRLRDFVPGGATDLADIDSPFRREHCALAQKLGMMYMVHVADPDTWFAAKYYDGAAYGTKAHQYIGLRRMLDLFPAPWVGAHMGGWPEDLAFLDMMLTEHPNFHIDTSATKWIVRELSRHSKAEVAGFLTKWSGRVLFGSDLVVMDDQLSSSKPTGSVMGELASSPKQAFELYASRYLALRLMFETDYDGPSPIADPDLAMVAPAQYDSMSCPHLRGLSLPPDVQRELYYSAADRLMNAWFDK